MKFPDVFFQVKVPAESLSARFAGERFGIVVCVHVEGQIVDLMESFAAYVAFVRLFSCVSQAMVLVVTFLVEAFAADITDEGFVSSVDADMSVQG